MRRGEAHWTAWTSGENASKVLIGLAFALLGALALDGISGALPGKRQPQSKPAAYYVDSRDGNHLNSGTTPASAWKSLAKVNSKTFHPGDRILLKSGSRWQGQLWPKGSGREGNPIVVDMYGGGVRPL